MDSSAAVSVAVPVAREDLESADVSRRIAAYAALSAFCRESKSAQHAVGSLLRQHPAAPHSAAAPQRLLAGVFRDLQDSDRTLRCAAARLVANAAYENLVNQRAILELAGGVSVGWVHVFSVPSASTAIRSCSVGHAPSDPTSDLPFLQSLVGRHYDRVYSAVSRYYASGCRAFLPLCWSFPSDKRQPQEPDDDGNDDDVPDPAEHLLGFFLVPRQTQFLEPDDAFHDELMQALSTSDLERLHVAKQAFDRVARVVTAQQQSHQQSQSESLGPSTPLDTDGIVPASLFREYCTTPPHAPSLAWLVDDTALPSTIVAPLAAYAGGPHVGATSACVCSGATCSCLRPCGCTQRRSLAPWGLTRCGASPSSSLRSR
ncbi:hypothetical protein PINS_up007957 [Pythium insidiosum]|nr:hypothetical protein PINS_up007957 [Pythium insidiosum]